MQRVRPPSQWMDEFLRGREDRNLKLLSSAKPSRDAELDEEAMSKTMAEVDRGVLKGPYRSLQDVPLDDVALVPRHGIWEMHGGTTDRSCRCIDDMLLGEQNGTVGTVSPHRPIDPDGLVAQVCATLGGSRSGSSVDGRATWRRLTSRYRDVRTSYGWQSS